MNFVNLDGVLFSVNAPGSQAHVSAKTVAGVDLGIILTFNADGSITRAFLSPAAQAAGFVPDVDNHVIVN